MIITACGNQNIIDDMEGNYKNNLVSVPKDNGYENGKISKYISIEDARKELEQILSDVYGNNLNQYSVDNSMADSSIIESSYTIYDESNNGIGLTRSDTTQTQLLHVFNFKNNGGYAIMGASEDQPTLYALTESGNLNEGAFIRNPGMAVLLDYLRWTLSGPEEPIGPAVPLTEYTVYGDWENIVYYRNGLCPVEWGQEDPYNMYCPKINGKLTVTGCLATAVAQFMSIYRHPTNHNGYDFNWEKMTEYKNGRLCCEVGKDNIARLMEQLGRKSDLNLSYGVDETSGKFEDIPRTFRNFNYSNGGTIRKYNTDEVIKELKKGNCIIVKGMRIKKDFKIFGWTLFSTYSKGHAWINHGLMERRRNIYHYKAGKLVSTTSESLWYPLCNWGDNGNDNGYFLSDVFNKSAGPAYPTDLEGISDSMNTTQNDSANYKYRVQTIIGISK